MSGIISAAAKYAHAGAVSLLAHSEIKTGASLPDIALKTKADTADVHIHSTPGKILIVGVPGAFTPSCSSQVPSYIQNYQKFIDKGFTAIYVVSVNDAFVVNAWKENLAPEGTGVQFVADDQGHFVGALGLIMDGTATLGGPRAKRFVIVAQDGKVMRVNVEQDSSAVTTTSADVMITEV